MPIRTRSTNVEVDSGSLPGPLHAQRPGQSRQGPRRDGRRRDQNDLHPTHQPGVRAHIEIVAQTLDQQFPAVAELLRDAREDITAFADFPEAHWRKIWSTNPLERLNKEVKRRTDVVGIFPDDPALLRLAACVLIEAHDEWQVSDRRYLFEASMAQLTPPPPTALEPRRDTLDSNPSEVIDTTTIKTA